MGRWKGYCQNQPVCRSEVRVRGYCDSCKELRKLLSEIHGDDRDQGRAACRRRHSQEDAHQRMELLRRRVMRPASKRHYQ